MSGAKIVAAPGGKSHPANAAYASAKDHVLLFQAQFIDRLQQPHFDRADGAALAGLCWYHALS